MDSFFFLLLVGSKGGGGRVGPFFYFDPPNKPKKSSPRPKIKRKKVVCNVDNLTRTYSHTHTKEIQRPCFHPGCGVNGNTHTHTRKKSNELHEKHKIAAGLNKRIKPKNVFESASISPLVFANHSPNNKNIELGKLCVCVCE